LDADVETTLEQGALFEALKTTAELKLLFLGFLPMPGHFHTSPSFPSTAAGRRRSGFIVDVKFWWKAIMGQMIFLIFRPISSTARTTSHHERPTHLAATLRSRNFFSLIAHALFL